MDQGYNNPRPGIADSVAERDGTTVVAHDATLLAERDVLRDTVVPALAIRDVEAHKVYKRA